MNAFFIALGLVFAAELGDKTQLVALCLAGRYNWRVVLSGILVATLVIHIASVLFGAGLAELLPKGWINLAAGLAFIGFGLWTLHGDSLEDDNCGTAKARSPFMLVATTFFLAELGDKTMWMTSTVAADQQSLAHATGHQLMTMIIVWLGSSLGMVLSDGLAILVGMLLGKRLPEHIIKIAATVIFFGSGIVMIGTGLIGKDAVPAYGWAVAAVTVVIMLGVFAIMTRRAQSALPELPAEPVEADEEPLAVGR